MGKNRLNLRRLLEYSQIDRAIFYGLIGNMWSLLAGPVTMFLMIKYFSSELQGYYFTFNTLIALRIFIESGFGIVVVSFASHEWAKLHLDSKGYLSGDSKALSRIISLARIVFRWHFFGGFIALVVIGIGGYFFFSADNSSLNINWKTPWVFLCIFTAINMWIVPALFLLEGCNQVKQIYFYRLVQGIIVAISSWIAIILGAGLWAIVINSAISIVCLVTFIIVKYKHFFIPMLSYTTTAVINWHSELWPMQWRIALSWISSYFISSFFTPLIFHYQGAIAAGQFGMTFTLFAILSSIASMWFITKTPQFGILISEKDFTTLDKQFFKSTKLAIGIFAVAAVILWLSIFSVYNIDIPLAVKLAVRIISPLSAGILLLAMFFGFLTQPFAIYLRAHNKDPYFFINVISAIFVATIAWILVKPYSILGVSIAYSAVMIFFNFPYEIIVWYRCRKKWHLK